MVVSSFQGETGLTVMCGRAEKQWSWALQFQRLMSYKQTSKKKKNKKKPKTKTQSTLNNCFLFGWFWFFSMKFGEI